MFADNIHVVCSSRFNFIYDNFRIPKGATYYIYNPLDTHKVTGGFTYRNNASEGQPFSSGMMMGSRFVLEYFEPKGVGFRGDISIIKTTHGYKNVIKHIDEYIDNGPSKAYDNILTDSTTYLKYWLDPLSTGITTLDGLYPNASCCLGTIRGNVDYDAFDIIDIADLVFLVDFMFRQGYPPTCEEEADIDGSSEIDISDLVDLIAYMFQGGAVPALCP